MALTWRKRASSGVRRTRGKEGEEAGSDDKGKGDVSQGFERCVITAVEAIRERKEQGKERLDGIEQTFWNGEGRHLVLL
jgi:hypothetical protein